MDEFEAFIHKTESFEIHASTYSTLYHVLEPDPVEELLIP